MTAKCRGGTTVRCVSTSEGLLLPRTHSTLTIEGGYSQLKSNGFNPPMSRLLPSGTLEQEAQTPTSTLRACLYTVCKTPVLWDMQNINSSNNGKQSNSDPCSLTSQSFHISGSVSPLFWISCTRALRVSRELGLMKGRLFPWSNASSVLRHRLL